MKCAMDPLFNKRIFLAFLLLICATAFASWFLKKSGPPSLPPDSAEKDLKTQIAADETSYELGFRTGFDAFLKQVGRYEQRPAVASYTSSQNINMDDAEVSRGYVDGYHKATELQSCPGGKNAY